MQLLRKFTQSLFSRRTARHTPRADLSGWQTNRATTAQRRSPAPHTEQRRPRPHQPQSPTGTQRPPASYATREQGHGEANLHQPPRSYLGPRYSEHRSLESLYTESWQAERRAATERATPPPPQREQPFEVERPSVTSPRQQTHESAESQASARTAHQEPWPGNGHTATRQAPGTMPQQSSPRVSSNARSTTVSGPRRLYNQLQRQWQQSSLRRQIIAIVTQPQPGQKRNGQAHTRSAPQPAATPRPARTQMRSGTVQSVNFKRMVHESIQTVRQPQQWSPATVMRMGVLSVILVLIWLTWPTAPTLPATRNALGHNALAMAPNLIAPAAAEGDLATGINVENAGQEAAASAGLSSILVPTATPGGSALGGTDSGSAVVTMRVNAEAIAAAGLNALSGILRPTATPARVDMAALEAVPQIEILPGVTINLPFGQPTPTPTPTPLPTPTPPPVNLEPGRLWSTFTPGPESDHFWVGQAFGPNLEQLASPSYQFGSTAGNRYRTHHGIDISNPSGTPVLAATDGVVVHAGLDDPELLGPYNNFYGNAVVIRLDRQLAVAGGQLDVYLLYGHLSQVTVSVGQRVRPEDVVGAVGMTGIAIGPHLHVEIRLGANTYFNNVNPYLWISPLEGRGAVAVRVLTADGRTWPGAAISLVRYAGGTAAWARQIITYQDVENIGPDPAWGENGAMDGVPAGSYYVVGVVNGERVSAEIEVSAGRTTFVELRTRQ